MKKQDLKKLALLGIAGGVVLGSQGANASQAAEQNTEAMQQYLSANGCGSRCGGRQAGKSGSRSRGQTAYNYYSSTGTKHSCGAHSCRTNDEGNSNGNASCNSKTGCNGKNGGSCGGKSGCSGKNGGSCGSNGSCNGQKENGKMSGMDYFYHRPNSQNHVSEQDTNSQRTRAANLDQNDLMSKLNENGKALFRGLSPEGKRLALQLANQTCKGENDCKGLNSCKTDKNGCAGEGGCKGQSRGPFKDPNQAVEVASKKMAQKRHGLNERLQSSRYNR